MQELIEILEGLKEELSPIVSDPKLEQYLDRCIELAKELPTAEETPAQVIARLEGKVEAYETALKHLKT